MPIQPSLNLQSVSDADFAVIDKAVMSCAYATHNKFGRLFDERIYENDLAARLRADGFDVHTQVPICVTHGSFQTIYKLDLVVNQMIYELKVVAALANEHDAQGLHDAMLQDVRLVKLLNFGASKVQGKLLANALSAPDRHRPTLRNSGWQIITPHCERLVNHLKELIHDWGTHLSCHLYNDALVHFCGGEAYCVQRVELKLGQLVLGTHPVLFYSPGFAFVVTALSRDQAAYQQHLEVLLSHTGLKGLQWINLNHSRVEITTLGMAKE